MSLIEQMIFFSIFFIGGTGIAFFVAASKQKKSILHILRNNRFMIIFVLILTVGYDYYLYLNHKQDEKHYSTVFSSAFNGRISKLSFYAKVGAKLELVNDSVPYIFYPNRVLTEKGMEEYLKKGYIVKKDANSNIICFISENDTVCMTIQPPTTIF